jgi:phosphotransferase system enzyme I (PtsI)
MASQPLMAFALIGLGVRTLSVAPRSVPLVKRIVRSISAAIAREAAEAAMSAESAATAEQQLRQRLYAAVGDAPWLNSGLPGGAASDTIRG